ncbi:transposable element Tc1 transposase [Trichonephila clavipes]|uniref:Transposable element Tc1 transposase n=1 Tax=Trichonephila clavipes TaxID=2585209 RepID=A0A8X6W7A1_TRICX|nr:transposable element Tc1 transposase [Trichonephila clavipes]
MWLQGDAGKNRWKEAGFSVMMVAVNLGPQQIERNNESSFQLCPNDYQRRVWRGPGQRVDPAFTIAYHTEPQPRVLGWGVISFDSHTPLVIFRGTLAAQRYIDDILRTVLLLFFALIKHFFGQPDLSSIENIWNMMGRRLYLPGYVNDLVQHLEKIWQEIPQETLRVPYHSMPRRVASCIQARGEST